MAKIKLNGIISLTLLTYSLVTHALTTDEQMRIAQLVAVNTRINKISFNSFLKEVFSALTSDTQLSAQIRAMQDSKMTATSGGEILKEAIADSFYKLPSPILRKLTELKRLELQRLLRLGDMLWRKGFTEREIQKYIKSESRHLDLSSVRKKEEETFSETDLRLLIRETNQRLIALDTARKDHFKEYEMLKKLEFQELKKRLSPEAQAEVDKNVDHLMLLHRRRKPAHLPLSKGHIMEVWEERDHMDRENLNMKSFFHLHDLDGNRMLDQNEIKVILEKEVDKIHDRNSPNFDPQEREEELERMREYTFKQVDENRDGLVSLTEFIQHNQRLDMTDTEFWESFGNKPYFTDEEFEKYAAENREEVNRMIDEGRITLPHTGVVKHFLKPKKK